MLTDDRDENHEIDQEEGFWKKNVLCCTLTLKGQLPFLLSKKNTATRPDKEGRREKV